MYCETDNAPTLGSIVIGAMSLRMLLGPDAAPFAAIVAESRRETGDREGLWVWLQTAEAVRELERLEAPQTGPGTQR